MNSIAQQSTPILSFLYDFDLIEGEEEFRAEIDFVLNGIRKIGDGQVRVIFNESDNHAIITISNTNWNVALLPLVLDSKQHDFYYIPGITLQVSGIDKNPFIGKFRVSIFPKIDATM